MASNAKSVFMSRCRHDWNHYTDVVSTHDDVTKWKHFPRYWPVLSGIHRSPVDSPHKASDAEPWYFIWSAWTNGWANNRDAGDLRRHRAHHDVTVMKPLQLTCRSGANTLQLLALKLPLSYSDYRLLSHTWDYKGRQTWSSGCRPGMRHCKQQAIKLISQTAPGSPMLSVQWHDDPNPQGQWPGPSTQAILPGYYISRVMRIWPKYLHIELLGYEKNQRKFAEGVFDMDINEKS